MSEDYYIRDLGLPDAEAVSDPFKDQDPFTKQWDDLKNLHGLEKNFKRRSDRIAKANNDTVVETSMGYNNVDVMSSSYQDSALAV